MRHRSAPVSSGRSSPVRFRCPPTSNRTCAQRLGRSPRRIPPPCDRCGTGSTRHCGSYARTKNSAQGLLDRRNELEGPPDGVPGQGGPTRPGRGPGPVVVRSDRVRAGVPAAVRPACRDPCTCRLSADARREAGSRRDDVRRTGMRRNRRRRLLRRLRYGAGNRCAAGDPAVSTATFAATAPASSTVRSPRRPAPVRRNPAAPAAGSAPELSPYRAFPWAIPPPRSWPIRRCRRGGGSAATPTATSPSGVGATDSRDVRRASAPSAARDTRSFPSFLAVTCVGGQYEVQGVHRARRPRLDLPGDRPQRAQPLGGAQGPAELRRRRRHGGGRRRSLTPGRSRAPEHRADPQLRRARRRRRCAGRLHRHGVRRRHLAQADPQVARTLPFPRNRPSPTSSRSRRLSATCTRKGWPTATSSPTT